MNQSKERLGLKYLNLSNIGPSHIEQTILIHARVQTSRPQGKSISFLSSNDNDLH